MKKWLIFLPILLLAGCATQPDGMQEALDFRTALMAGETCTFQTEVTADLGDSVYQFAMDCDYADKTAHLTVTAPTEIAGISATVQGDSATLTFEDVAFTLPTEVGGNIPPMVLPKILGDAWVGGFIQWATVESDGYTIQYALEQPANLWVQTRFDETMTPTYVEIYEGGYLVLTASISDFSP
ncbi:MAG: hypothetical protein R3Y62_03425 [Eubacteriales bacterium]